MTNITVINPFEVPQGREDEALSMWETFAEYFRKQPGYISTKPHSKVIKLICKIGEGQDD